MARKKAGQKKGGSNLIINDESIGRIVASITDLLNTHADEIAEAIEDSDNRCLHVGVPLAFDCSESAPEIEVGFRFSEAVTDKRTIMCDDPKQGTFSIFTPEALEQRKEQAAEGGDEPDAGDGKPARRRKKKESEPAEEGADQAV